MMKALTQVALLLVLGVLPLQVAAQAAPAADYAAALRQYRDGRTDSAFVEALARQARQAEDWTTYARLRDERNRRYPPKAGGGLNGDAWRLNVEAWDVFENCNDTTVLARALAWSELSLGLEPDNVQVIDTKANLLYKLGRVDEAITWEQKAIEQGIINAKKRGREKGDFFDDFTAVLAKMRRGEPTWPQRRTENR